MNNTESFENINKTLSTLMVMILEQGTRLEQQGMKLKDIENTKILQASTPVLAETENEESYVFEVPKTDLKPKASKRDRESLSRFGDFQEKIRGR